MKLNKYIWMAALPMLLSACQEDALVDNPQGQGGKFVLKASVDEKGSFSRAQIKLEEQKDGRKYGAFQWDEGDTFRMYEIEVDEEWNQSLGATHDFEISGYSNASPSTSATFVSETTPTNGNQFYAYYPSLELDQDGYITMKLNSELQDNSADSWKTYFNRNMFMMAEGQIRGTETMLRFNHQCGLINVSYTNESGSSQYIEGVKLNGHWGVTKIVNVLEPWRNVRGQVSTDYGISFVKPVEVASGETEDFFILFMQPDELMDSKPEKMSQLFIEFTDEANSSVETKATDAYPVGMPTFYNREGYRLNVKHTSEDKLVWTKAPVVEGFKVSTPEELVAALQSKEDSIALSADIVLEAPLGITYDVTLDLVGHNISMVQDKLEDFKNDEDALIVVHRGGHLTINDISNGVGFIDPGINYPTSTIKMVGKNDEGTDLAKLTINEARLAGYNVISGTKGKGNTEIVINGGDINGGWDIDENGKGATGIFHPQAGTLTINGGSIRGCQSAIEMRAGTLIANGGTINSNQNWRTRHEPVYDPNGDGTTMRSCVAIGISQGDDNLPINVTIGENVYFYVSGEDTYAIYEVDLHDNQTDNVEINIAGTESRLLNIPCHIYSENQKGFIGSYTDFDSPSALSYIAAGAKSVHVNCRDAYSGPAAYIPDSEEGNGAEVTVNLSGKTWTIESADADNNYFYIGKNNTLRLTNGIVAVPEDATGLSLIKAKDAELNLQNVTINSYNVHYAVDVEDGKTLFMNGQVNAGEGCYAFNIKAASLERDEPMFDLMNGNRITGNFKMEIGELPASNESLKAPVMYINDTFVDGDLYFIGDNITNERLFYCVQYDKNSVDFSEESTGWDSVQNPSDENLPALPVYITDLNWIAVIEASYNGELDFVKNTEGYVDVNNLTNLEIIESITDIEFSDELATDRGLDYSKIEELKFIEKFKSLESLNLRETSVDTLDLSNNTELTNVTISYNKLTSLNLAGCNKLDQIICTENDLTALDLSECGDVLTYVAFNLPSLTDLNVSNCPNLERLMINGSNLSDFTLPATTKVKYLELQGTSIKSLNINESMGVEYLNCYLPFGLTSLELSDCDDLKEVNFYNNGGGDYKYDISAINVEGCDNLKKFGFSEFNNHSEIEAVFSNCPSLETLSVFDCKTLDITGCNSLKTLGCSGGSLTSLDVSSCTNLQVLKCGSNQLTELVFPENSILSELSCANNNFSKLDVSGLSELTTLWCQNNQLTELNVEGLNKLEELICSDNQLTSLSVKDLSNLKTLECGFNKLTSLDVSNMKSLEELDFYYNDSDMELLNLSGLSCITELDLLDFNASYGDITYKIKELNVSNCPNLTEITFYEGIGLEVLDISGRTSGDLPDNPNLLTFKNAEYAKGLKVLKLEQWHFDWYDSIYGVWGSFTSGDQTFDETYPRPHYYKGYPYPRFEYPNGYTEVTE